jgi:hypothetical protein
MIHMLNAFQPAEYLHVVGMLWERICNDGVQQIYKYLRLTPPENPSYHKVVYSLHRSIRKLMQDRWFHDDFLAWNTFIHIGIRLDFMLIPNHQKSLVRFLCVLVIYLLQN